MITLENRTIKLSVDTKGGQWTSLIDKETMVEHLFQGNPDSWTKQAPLLFPIIGLLKDNKYIYHGELFELSRHGFLRDQEFEVVSSKTNEVVLRLTHTPDTLAVYPFEFNILITYTLKKNRVESKVEVTNVGDLPMYFSFGGHPGFIINTNEKNILKVETKKDFGQFILRDGYVEDFKAMTDKEFNLAEVDLEETFILAGVKKAVLDTPTHEVILKMSPVKYMGFWAPRNTQTNQLEEMVCLEPWWGIADCIDHNQHLKDKKGITKLDANETKKFKYVVEIKNKALVPDVIGPYSMSSETDELIYTSGQLPVNPRTNQIEVFDIKDQTRQVLKNVKAVLAHSDKGLADVIKTTVFLKDMNDFSAMNEVYGEFFKKPYPARSAIEVARLPKDALVEIEVIAKK